ncbi:UNVERIFIED_CONTAM: Fatty acid desaturase 4, chloroplastic [Sesamum latifolium]|uniref:Fatty acid desaturase 4, chloroplastic n=1 Tax=Sesamum latifolium TaxID=2727402 RepID=A0AAW2WN79_9LAMI
MCKIELFVAEAAPTKVGRRSTALLSLFKTGQETCLGSSGNTSPGRKGALKACTFWVYEQETIRTASNSINIWWVLMILKESVIVGGKLKKMEEKKRIDSGGCTTVLVSLAKSAIGAVDSHIWLEPILSGFVGYVLADLGSGIYHWGIDNYGGAETPVFGGQIEAFQGHHKWPWTITRREFANNLHALARAVTFTVLPINLLCDDAVLLGFVGVCAGCIMFSQQFHAWAHTTKSRLPGVVVALQDGGVLVSRMQHAAHHRAPYNNNYCIVSGVWNEVLDGWRAFEAMEMVIFFKFGVRPRSWSDPDSDWTEEPAETTSFVS